MHDLDASLEARRARLAARERGRRTGDLLMGLVGPTGHAMVCAAVYQQLGGWWCVAAIGAGWYIAWIARR